MDCAVKPVDTVEVVEGHKITFASFSLHLIFCIVIDRLMLVYDL